MPTNSVIMWFVPKRSMARSLIQRGWLGRKRRAWFHGHGQGSDRETSRAGRAEGDRRIDQSAAAPAPNEVHAICTPRPPLGQTVDMGIMRFGRAALVDAFVADAADPLGGLLRRAGRGDQIAFAELYDRLAPVVFGVVLKVVRDPSQSEEVAQEVFIELWRLAARYDGTKGSVTSWAATMAHRRAIDRVRSEQSARNRVAREVSNLVPDHDDVVGQVEVTLDQARVRRALEQLSPLQREALELAYFGGHTYREVAVLLDVAEGTVKTRIRDGMIRMRDELGGTQ